MDTENVMTIPEVATHLGISVQAVYLAISEGRLKTVKVLGKNVVMKSDVAGYQPRSYRDRKGSVPQRRDARNSEN